MTMSIRAKLFASFGVILALAVLVGVTGATGLSAVGDKTHRVNVNGIEPLGHIGSARTYLAMLRADLRDHILAPDAAKRATFDAGIEEKDGMVTKQLTEMGDHLATAADRRLLATATTNFAAYRKYREPVLEASRAGDDQLAYARLFGEAVPPYKKAVAALEKLAANIEADGDHLAGEAEATASSRRTLSTVLLVVAVLLGGAIAWFLSRAMSRDVGKVLEAADGIAEGDLDQDVTVRSRDEIGKMAEAFQRMVAYLNDMAASARTIAAGDLTTNVEPRSDRDVLGRAMSDMRESLTAMVAEVSRTATSLSASSEEMAATSTEAGRAVDEIAQAVQDIAHGAERQVSSVDAVRTAAEEMQAATEASARNAEETSAAAAAARDVAARGAQAVTDATDAMQAVRSSSQAVSGAMRELAAKSEQIGTIVETITGIAGQTNLLALNAAIEAARAGDQGRGFAVVADEVRKLAEESQTAAESISALVAEIQTETGRAVEIVEDGARRSEAGAETVAEAHEAFDAIGRSVEDMTARIEQIAAAAQQIAASAGRVQDDMVGVASVAEESSASTEQVSASTEETSASAQEISTSASDLALQAEQLTALVGRFRIGA